MKHSILPGLFVFFLGVQFVFATPFEEANQRFKSGDFVGAAATYEKLLADEGPRASVYYNLGNCYQSLKKYGPAILAYEQARLLTPRDPDLLANLSLARKAVAVVEDVAIHPWFDAVIRYLSRHEWSWVLVGSAMVLGALGLGCGVLTRSRRFTIGAAGLSAIVLLLSAGVLYLRQGESLLGVVLSENAAVRLSPFEKAESLGTAGQGRLVRMGPKNGNFQHVEVPGSSLQGWLDVKDVRAISPEAR